MIAIISSAKSYNFIMILWLCPPSLITLIISREQGIDTMLTVVEQKCLIKINIRWYGQKLGITGGTKAESMAIWAS